MQKHSDVDTGFENLANAIVLQAVEDFRWARRALKQDPGDPEAHEVYRETRRFLKSRWCSELTTLDCEVLLDKLMREKV